MLITSILVFIGLLLLLVLVHEWGHFIAAKRAGCEVEEFGFGFPPRLLSFTRAGTKYSLNLLPIGGFVKIKGEDMDDPAPGPGSFSGKSAAWRTVILAAGVVMNVILAWVLLAVQGIVGVPTLVTEDNAGRLEQELTYIVTVSPDSPAAAAGLEPLDRVVRVGGLSEPTVAIVQQAVTQRAGEGLELEVDRQGQRLVASVEPRVNPPPGEGALGVTLAATGLERVPWWQAPWHGLTRTIDMLIAIVMQFGLLLRLLVTEGAVTESLTGPIGIAIYSREVTQLGLSYILEFGALISLNLAIINILPVPALDGGRILFVALEKIRGRRFAGNFERVSHTIGFVLLIALMLFITLKDVRRFF